MSEVLYMGDQSDIIPIFRGGPDKLLCLSKITNEETEAQRGGPRGHRAGDQSCGNVS